MAKYIDREALVEWLKRIPLIDLSDGRGLCRVIMEDDFKKAIKKCRKALLPMLSLLGMGGGLSKINMLLAHFMTALFATIAFLTPGIHGTTAQIVDAAWTDVMMNDIRRSN